MPGLGQLASIIGQTPQQIRRRFALTYFQQISDGQLILDTGFKIKQVPGHFVGVADFTFVIQDNRCFKCCFENAPQINTGPGISILGRQVRHLIGQRHHHGCAPGPADGMEPGLKETAFYDPTNFTFPAGAYVCEVDVDPGTGKTDIVNFVAADDFGRLINPMIVEGQVHGGLAQGIGQAMLEGAVYDKSGQLVTASFMDYAMPRADDLPSFKVSHTMTPCPSNPLGIKGCGEAGAIGSTPAVINAITDAIGNNKLEMPASPDRVWHAIHQQQAAE